MAKFRFIQHRFIFAAVFVAILIAALPMYWPGSILKVSPESLMQMMVNGEPSVIIDVRSEKEFQAGHLPFAINVSMPSLFFEHDDLAISRQERVVVYCGVGIRARLASFYLRMVGFDTIYLLEGHVNAWKTNGYPLIQPSVAI